LRRKIGQHNNRILAILTSDVHPADKFKALLEEFYSDSPARLKASLLGLTFTVKKPSSDQEQD
jgi:hypothetical protein